MLAACEHTTSPIVAGIGGNAAPPGSVNNNVTPLLISPSRVQLIVGGTIQFTTNAPPSLRSQVQWSSSPSTVATVSPSGFATAVAVGTATITARYAFDTTNVSTATVDVSGTTMANPGMGVTTGGGSGTP